MRCRQLLDLFERISGLVRERACAPLTHDQMRLDIGTLQRFEQTDSKDGTGCTGNADDESGNGRGSHGELILECLPSRGIKCITSRVRLVYPRVLEYREIPWRRHAKGNLLKQPRKPRSSGPRLPKKRERRKLRAAMKRGRWAG